MSISIVNAFNISLIIPIYNEAEHVAALCHRLMLLEDWVANIIIVDGGSTDGCVEVIEKHFNVIHSEKGRAHQMNVGAEQAKGVWLFFLHADTEFSLSHLQEAMSKATLSDWGRFNVRLSGRHWILRLVERMMNIRSAITGIATGDQCIFVRRELFNKVGRYNNIPLMEDVNLSKKLKKWSRPAIVKKTIKTSSRKWEEQGILSTIVLMWKLRFLFWFGVSPEKLVKQYYNKPNVNQTPEDR